MFDTLVQVGELASHIGDPRWRICDCRYDLADPGAGRHAFAEAHIPGAVYVDLHDDLSDPAAGGGRHPLPAPARMQALFGDLGIDASTQVVCYDGAGGSYAARLWWMLRYMGHDAAAVLDGGWQAWCGAGGEVSDADWRPAPVRFSGTPRREWLVTVDEVPAQRLLVDSRDPARFRGELEPIDPVAGHIPGARNRFWKRNVDERGRFLSAQQLRRELQSLYGATPPEAATFYCGSGVTACHNLLAAAHAGLPMPRLYAGSWSEWCSDPARAVAKGEPDVL